MAKSPSRRRSPTEPGVLYTLGDVVVRLGLMAVLIVGAALLLGASLAPTASVAAAIVRTIDADLLDYPPLPEDLRQLAERSVILDRNGDRLAIVREENRVLVALDDVPEHARQAVLATEDADFYAHEGVHWRAVARAALGNVQAGEITSGASTITQQLVKNLVLDSDEQTLDRKLQEAVYAIQLEQRMAKDEILESYLNTAYFANGVYGIGTAAEFYWGKHVSELTVAEAALLAGMLRAPEINNPLDRPEQALARRAIVLGQMARLDLIGADDAERYADEPLELEVGERRDASEDFLITHVIESLKRNPALGPDEATRFRALATGGLTVKTTIDPRMQQLARDVIAEHLSPEDEPLAALTAVDPRSGEILAVGFGPRPFGPGEGRVDVNPALPHLGSPGRQTGSAFKPFAAVAAIEDGLSPSYTIDTPSPYTPERHCTVPGWSPGNYSDGGGGVMDMTRATAVSSNVYFVHIVDQIIGPQRLKETAERLGIDKTLGGNCASVLGTDDVHMLDMASAFGTLANGGVHCEPFLITEVVDRDGRVLHRGGDRCGQVLDAGIAARVTHMLEGPIASGTASRHGQVGRPAAGKTGTSQNYENAWFVGYVPQLSTAVWMGHEEPAFMSHPACPRGVTGGCVPTMIWRDFMRAAFDELELAVEGFPSPPPLPTDTVPHVVGLQLSEATATVEDAGFQTIVEPVAHFAPEGQVVQQDPAGGATAPSGSAVRLHVSDGSAPPPAMPLLVGLSEREARERLAATAVELALEVTYVPVDDADVDAVVAQRPAEGSELIDGRTVRLEIGRQRTDDDPQPTPTPTPTPESPSERPSPTPPPASPTPTPTPTESANGSGDHGNDGAGGDEGRGG